VTASEVVASSILGVQRLSGSELVIKPNCKHNSRILLRLLDDVESLNTLNQLVGLSSRGLGIRRLDGLSDGNGRSRSGFDDRLVGGLNRQRGSCLRGGGDGSLSLQGRCHFSGLGTRRPVSYCSPCEPYPSCRVMSFRRWQRFERRYPSSPVTSTINRSNLCTMSYQTNSPSWGW
jgi:hypothetical protein